MNKLKKNKRVISCANTPTKDVKIELAHTVVKPIFRFEKLDRNGSFAFDLNRTDFDAYDFLQKMINYSQMSWIEIEKQTHDNGKSKHHY